MIAIKKGKGIEINTSKKMKPIFHELYFVKFESGDRFELMQMTSIPSSLNDIIDINY